MKVIVHFCVRGSILISWSNLVHIVTEGGKKFVLVELLTIYEPILLYYNSARPSPVHKIHYYSYVSLQSIWSHCLIAKCPIWIRIGQRILKEV